MFGKLNHWPGKFGSLHPPNIDPNKTKESRQSIEVGFQDLGVACSLRQTSIRQNQLEHNLVNDCFQEIGFRKW